MKKSDPTSPLIEKFTDLLIMEKKDKKVANKMTKLFNVMNPGEKKIIKHIYTMLLFYNVLSKNKKELKKLIEEATKDYMLREFS